VTGAIGPVAVIGASLAGVNAVQALLESDAVTSVTVYSGEPLPSCDRPALSKELLTGVWEAGQCALALPDDPRVTWRETRIVGFDPASLTLTQTDETVRPYTGGVVLATGTRPRSFPGDHLAGVHVVRTLRDALALRADIDRPGRSRIVVVGGGFIGVETAAACLTRGHSVTVLETMNAPFERIVGADVGHAIVAPLTARGLVVRTGVGVSHVREQDGRADAVVTTDGEVIPADVVVLGVGVQPAVDWAEGSGLDVTRGVECDETLLVAPRIVAAGDIALWPNRRYGETRRVEHWDNAVRQGYHAGRRLLAEHGRAPVERFELVPWVWSDQLDNKIAIVGSTVGFDEFVVADGDLDSDRFLVLYRRGDELSAVLGMNRMKTLTRFRRELARPVGWDEAIQRYQHVLTKR
jgi:NADPH-dependent 2,4-dienoyl-CoA reductase/sulfur reductase-like enzyme